MSKAEVNPNPSIEALSEDYVRLHITPFNDSLLKSYIAPSVLPLARNISFHILQSFPERPFGYVELPKIEAEKMKKKLNGRILKGQKVKIDKAKPENGKIKVGEANEEAPEEKSGKSKSAQVKEEQGVLPGVELEEGRKIKRGWTEPVEDGTKKRRKKDKEGKKSKEAETSKYTQEPEMLFRTKPHPDPEMAKKKRKGGKGNGVVHEFEKRKILPKRGVDAEERKLAREYVEGKGWVDSDGNVIESEKKGKKTVAPASSMDAQHKQGGQPEQSFEQTSPSVDPEQLARDQRKAEKWKKRDERHARRAAERAEKDAEARTDPNPQEQEDKEPNWTASSSALEALYKRRGISDIAAPLSLPSSTKASPTKLPPINTSTVSKFGFGFGDGDEEEEGDDVPPLTPFSREDRATRSIRSAAPTPDTAAIGRKFSFSFLDVDKDEDEDGSEDAENDEDDTGEVGLGVEEVGNVHPERQGQVEKEESEFSKWFWEHRGENNRAWKKRRKEAMKGKRQRENRRIGRKVV